MTHPMDVAETTPVLSPATLDYRGGGQAPRDLSLLEHAMAQGPQIYGKGGQSAGGALVWAALLRKLDRENPGYDV